MGRRIITVFLEDYLKKIVEAPDEVAKNILAAQDIVPRNIGLTIDEVREINDRHLTLLLNRRNSDVYHMYVDEQPGAMIVRKAYSDPQLVMVYRGTLIPLDGSLSVLKDMIEKNGKESTKEFYNECIDHAQEMLDWLKEYVNSL